jgi:phage terminase large subunit-like protein
VTTLVVPSLDETPWPTLGPQVWEWQLENLVYGPGDLRGIRLRDQPPDPEYQALLYRAYEIYPQGHKDAGKRRFKRVALSMRKGTAKTEKAAWIAAGELHPDAPVRCNGFDARGNPVGVGVNDPYIPMVAYTEEQTEELAYGALLVVIGESPLANDFDIGLERIMRIDGAGKALALASAPDSRDGARTTFQHFDETHRFILSRLKAAHQTMQANLPKRPLADPWGLETTTAPTPGEDSVAEGTMEYAKKIAAGKVSDPRMFFFHRQAGDEHDLDTSAGLRAAVIEASGPAAEWSDIDGIVALAEDPQTDRAYWERVWLNRLVQSASQAFDVERWDELSDPEHVIPDGALVALGFDGSRTRDATALVATEVATGFQHTLGVWERPPNREHWEVPVDEVHTAIAAAHERWTVYALYCDPPYWETQVNEWAGRYPKVVEWWTNRPRVMANAIRGFVGGIVGGDLGHDGSPTLRNHIGNARRETINMLDEQGERLWVIRKERPDSPQKIDAAMAAILSWEARGDALASGILNVKPKSRVPIAF